MSIPGLSGSGLLPPAAPEHEGGGLRTTVPREDALAVVCPVLLLNSEYDDLRASAEVFAGLLAVAGVDVRQVLVRGMLHGFLNLHAGIEPVDRALGLMAEVVVGDRALVPA